MNLIDKTVNYFSPKKALERATARVKLDLMNSGYSRHGASMWKKAMRGWNTSTGTADEDITDNVHKLRERSRDLYMGAPIATGALKTKRTAVIGRGLRAKPSIDYEVLGISREEAREVELKIEKEWKAWAGSTNCDSERKHNFYTLQRLLKLSMDMNGDVFWIPKFKRRAGTPFEFCVELIEGDRVTNKPGSSSNKVREGVEVNDEGEIVAYHIAVAGDTEYRYSYQRVEAYGKRTGERMVYHLFDPERIGQRRGVPALAPVIESLKQLTRYTEAEITRSVIAGMFSVFITSKEQQGSLMGMGNIEGDEKVTEESEETIELGSGNVAQLAPGEDVKSIAPNAMNIGFELFVKAVCTQVGAALEIPVDVLLKQFNSSYSASRAALMEFWRVALSERDYIVQNFCQPVYEKFLIDAIDSGRVVLPGFFEGAEVRRAYSRCTWVGENKGHLDPVKEINAAVKRVELGISSREIEAQEHGNDWEEVQKQLATEKKKREEDGLEEQKVLGN